MLNSENRMAAAAKSGWIQGEFTHKFCGGAKKSKGALPGQARSGACLDATEWRETETARRAAQRHRHRLEFLIWFSQASSGSGSPVR